MAGPLAKSCKAERRGFCRSAVASLASGTAIAQTSKPGVELVDPRTFKCSGGQDDWNNSRSSSIKYILAIIALAITGSVAGFGSEGRQAADKSPEHVSFPTQDGGIVYADMYGNGHRGVVLAHGGRFTKESWEKQARQLVTAGFLVLAIDFRGYGQSRGPTETRSGDDGLRFDVLAAVRYLRRNGARTVSIVGASFGGGAAAEAAVEAKPGEIDGLVLLAHSPIDKPELMKSRKLFILTKDDANGAGVRLPGIQKQYERSPGPKKLVILEGSAHAQFIFATEQGERLMREILRFLSKR